MKKILYFLLTASLSLFISISISAFAVILENDLAKMDGYEYEPRQEKEICGIHFDGNEGVE